MREFYADNVRVIRYNSGRSRANSREQIAIIRDMGRVKWL